MVRKSEVLLPVETAIQGIADVQAEMLGLARSFAHDADEPTPVRLKAIEVTAKVATSMLVTLQMQEDMRIVALEAAREALRPIPEHLFRPTDPFEPLDRARAARVLQAETAALGADHHIEGDTIDAHFPNW